ncbi:unnamed protein product [Polarella glacialis]|uniref:PAS domain-containing protein n=2 Tax=Polarella glacialis TaxID=89957 RepID=A0A813FUS2_POLGL|nr:unnamed protein product [Polarella glacialis]
MAEAWSVNYPLRRILPRAWRIASAESGPGPASEQEERLGAALSFDRSFSAGSCDPSDLQLLKGKLTEPLSPHTRLFTGETMALSELSIWDLSDDEDEDEQEVTDQLPLLQAALDAIAPRSCAVTLSDPYDATTLMVSDGFEALFGFTRCELLGKDELRVLSGDFQQSTTVRLILRDKFGQPLLTFVHARGVVIGFDMSTGEEQWAILTLYLHASGSVDGMAEDAPEDMMALGEADVRLHQLACRCSFLISDAVQKTHGRPSGGLEGGVFSAEETVAKAFWCPVLSPSRETSHHEYSPLMTSRRQDRRRRTSRI